MDIKHKLSKLGMHDSTMIKHTKFNEIQCWQWICPECDTEHLVTVPPDVNTEYYCCMCSQVVMPDG